ncbi:MAG: hypothetical protein V7776_18305 [Halopseudomonas aestusnigri]
MRDFKLIIIVFVVGFIGFFGIFYTSNNGQAIEVALDIPSKSGNSKTMTFLDTFGMALGVIPEVMHAEFLSPYKQSSWCQISAPSKDAKIIWINTMSSDFVSPIQIENGSSSPMPTGLVNVSVGDFDQPLYLFLQSYTDVVWNLNVPDGVVVEGVVAVSLVPSAIANVPDGAEKLVMTYEANEKSFCSKFPPYSDFDNESGVVIYEKEVTDYLGRKPDIKIRKESENLFVFKDENAPAQGISRLDARKIYSPAKMLVGKKAYSILYVEETQKSGSTVKIDYRDAVNLLTASVNPSNGNSAGEVKDQFLSVPENYRVVLSDFDLSDDFLNENPRTFFIPSDVDLASLTIPPSTNPAPRLPPALKPALRPGEIEEEPLNEIFESQEADNAFMMSESDKYFRRIGVHSFAPLNLTVAEIQELFDFDMSKVE